MIPVGMRYGLNRRHAVEQGLSAEQFSPLIRLSAPLADFDTIALCHSNEYLDELRHMAPKEGMVYIDGDTSMSPSAMWRKVSENSVGA